MSTSGLNQFCLPAGTFAKSYLAHLQKVSPPPKNDTNLKSIKQFLVFGIKLKLIRDICHNGKTFKIDSFCLMPLEFIHLEAVVSGSSLLYQLSSILN